MLSVDDGGDIQDKCGWALSALVGLARPEIDRERVQGTYAGNDAASVCLTPRPLIAVDADPPECIGHAEPDETHERRDEADLRRKRERTVTLV